MWRWLNRLFTSKASSSFSEDGDRLVTDSEYEFNFGTQPKEPDGLRDLKITKLGTRLLLLDNFDADLNIAQHHMFDNPKDIAWATRSLRWSKTYHSLSSKPQPPVRLHNKNVVLLSLDYSKQHPADEDIVFWLKTMAWQTERPFVLEVASSKSPLEDGFFTCARLAVTEVPPAPTLGLNWERQGLEVTSVVATLTAFVEHELNQPWGAHCEGYLRTCYSDLPPEQLTHPIFAMLDYPVFDMGLVQSTFAASVNSPNELRLWSRPTYYHK